MRRIVIGFASTVSAVVLLFSYKTSTGASVSPVTGIVTASGAVAGAAPATTGATATGGTPSTTASTAPSSTAASTAATRTLTGTAVSTRYGPVQVQVTVSGTTITAATATEYPTGDRRSAQINATAVPVLQQETIAAQSAGVDAVSGASYTSQGYITSLQSALDQL